MTYNAKVISNYIVNYSLEEDRPITNLKLQKILYFLQLKFLGEKNRKLFENDIEKWKLGPVIPDVYHDYKMFGSNYINFPIEILIGNEEDIEVSDGQMIRSIIDDLIDVDSFTLVDRTHRHSSWIDAEDEILKGVKGIKYSLKDLKKAYKEDLALNV